MVKFSKNSLKILEKRYLLKDEKGNIIETPEKMLKRVSDVVCGDNEKLKNKILEMMNDLRFLPNTPTLMNAGVSGMLSACFSIDINDNLESIIHDGGWQQALIHKCGGGVGINFSKLRPKGDRIKTTGGVSSGVLGFLEVFNVLSEVIRQGGKRDGANMGLLSISHPEIEDWIKSKVGNNKFRNFNLSVLVTDKFMEAVEKDEYWDLKFNNKTYKKVKARYLFDLIAESAWKCGCPGMVFIDEINRNNPLKDIMYIEHTNPCCTGDTKICTVNGPKNFKELAEEGKDVEVLTENHRGDLVFRKMHDIKLTRKDSNIMRIYLDNDEHITCTPDHNIFIRYGKYRYKMVAEFLKIGDCIWTKYLLKDESKERDLKITRIEYLKEKEEKEDVYNGIVDETHKYFVLAGKDYAILSGNCGELPIYVGNYDGEFVAESCNLGSLNLSKYVEFDKFDYDKFREDIGYATEFLDMIIDVNNFPFDFIKKGTLLTRKIGLGITGLHECLVKLGLKYGSEKSIEFIENITTILRDSSHRKSEEIGKEKGFYPLAEKAGIFRRNLYTTSIAPTGTIGRFMLGHPYSSGIEPPYALYTQSNIIDSKIDDDIYPALIDILKERNLYKKEIIDKIIANGKSIQNIEEIPLDIRELFLVAEEIDVETHIKIQSTVQKYVDHAVSKTVNLPYKASIEDIKKAFMLAYKERCKGVTIYRDLSKDKQVFEVPKLIQFEEIKKLEPRPKILPGLTFEKETGCSTLFITPTKLWNQNAALESFINKSTEMGGCIGLQDGLAIAISVYNRYIEGLDFNCPNCGFIYPNFGHLHSVNALKIVMNKLLKKTCRVSEILMKKQEWEISKGNKPERMIDSLSCPNAIAQCFMYMLEHKIDVLVDGKIPDMSYDKGRLVDTNQKIIHYISNINCPECGNKLIRQEGCANDTCMVCGWGGCV